jgi:hypothetical protein
MELRLGADPWRSRTEDDPHPCTDRGRIVALGVDTIDDRGATMVRPTTDGRGEDMADALEDVAPVFVEMAHRIVWATAATVDSRGEPSTRILHPIWQWDGESLTGWVATSPRSPKARHLAATPRISFTYWHPNQDTCTVRCSTAWEDTPEQRAEGWRRFAEAPAPVGYDPSIIPQWPDPQAPEFGILRLEPTSLRLLEGTVMTSGAGRMLTWNAARAA